MDLLSAEMEVDRQEEREYALADERQKKFMEWRQVWDSLKYCLIVVALSLLLIIQIVGLCHPSDNTAVVEEAIKRASQATYDFWREYIAKNGTLPAPQSAD